MVIKSEGLRKAVLSVWLGRKPIQYDLKYALLKGHDSAISQQEPQENQL